jgi:lysophospholipase L1-like esterase
MRGGWSRILAAALGLLFAAAVLLALEGWFSLTERRPKYRYSPALGYELVPGYRGRQETVNLEGLRGPEIGPRRPGSLRILAMGESTTWGHMVRDDETWPALLEQRLRQATGRDVEVLNGGVSGWGLEQIVLALEEGYLRRFAPDQVIVFAGWNNPVLEGNGQVAAFRRDLGLAPRFAFVDRLALGRRLRVWLRELRPRERAGDRKARTARRASAEKSAEAFPRLAPRLRDACQARDAELALIRFPALTLRPPPSDPELREAYEEAIRYRYGEREDLATLVAVVRELHAAALAPVERAAAQAQIELLDVSARMLATLPQDGEQADARWVGYFRDHFHFTPEGNAAVADAVASLLLEQGRLHPRAAPPPS